MDKISVIQQPAGVNDPGYRMPGQDAGVTDPGYRMAWCLR